MREKDYDNPKSNIIRNIHKDIISWNNNFPFDYVWRKKYGVAFGSTEHRHMSFLDMIQDLEEDKMFGNILKNGVPNEEEKNNFLSDEEFDNVDINQY